MNQKTITILLIIGLLFSNYVSATAQKCCGNAQVEIEVNGTSSQHNWKMNSSKGKLELAFQGDESNPLISLKKLHFMMPVHALKSGNKVMDKKAYNAFKADENRHIIVDVLESKLQWMDERKARLNCQINLTIAGHARRTDLVIFVEKLEGDTYVLSGEKSVNMTDYQMEPPAFMFGIFKVNENVNLMFKIKTTLED